MSSREDESIAIIATPDTSILSEEEPSQTKNSGSTHSDNPGSLDKTEPGTQQSSTASSSQPEAQKYSYVYLHCIEIDGDIRYQFGSISPKIGVKNDRWFSCRIYYREDGATIGTWNDRTCLQYEHYNRLNYRIKFTLDQEMCEEVNTPKAFAILHQASKIERKEDVPGYKAVMESIERKKKTLVPKSPKNELAQA